jgi:hypothetical protein
MYSCVRVRSREDPQYHKVSDHMRLLVASAGDDIVRRWEAEDQVNAGTQL